MKHLFTLLFSLILTANSVASELMVSGQYVRATPPHTKNSAAFLSISNHANKTIKLIAASSDIADRVELHNHIKEDGMMKMRQVKEVVIEANSSVTLQPGGYHVMFLGLKNDLKEGQIVNITLYFNNGDEININAPVQKISMSHEKMHH